MMWAHDVSKKKVSVPPAPARLPELLQVAHFLWRVPEGGVASFYRSFEPDLVAAAQRLPPPDSGATLADAFAAVDS
jgi:hypothetical protein